MNPTRSLLRARRRAARHHRRHPAGPVGDAVHRAADDAHDQAAAERRDPGADLLVRRRALRRLAHRDPAEHPRHRRQRGVVRRRLCARAAAARPAARSASRPRARSSARCSACSAWRRSRRCSPKSRCRSAPSSSSGSRCSASTMSGSIVGDDPLKGWLMGAARPVRGADRPGRPLRLQPLHLRLGRALRRHRADPGAGRRVRPRRSADDARRPDRAQASSS